MHKQLLVLFFLMTITFSQHHPSIHQQQLEYYNENYELNNEKEVSLHIKNKDGVIYDYVFSKNTNFPL